MKNINLNDNIDTLRLNDNISDKLHKLDINIINDLWENNRVFYKEKGFKDYEIHEIKVKLQLKGIDLNKKIYSSD